LKKGVGAKTGGRKNKQKKGARDEKTTKPKTREYEKEKNQKRIKVAKLR